MADYPTREDFVWHGVEQLSEVPQGCENGCSICLMLIVSDASSTTEGGHEHVPLQNAQDLQNDESSTTIDATNSNCDVVFITVHAASTTVSNTTEQNTENTLPTVAVSVGNNALKSDVAEELEDGPFIRIRACSHIFHTTCLRTWLRNEKNTCPLCRRILFAASCRHNDELQQLATLEQRLQRFGRIQAFTIACIEEENAMLKKIIENMETGYLDFVSDCTIMFFVAVMVALALYAWWKS